jgi:endonuclease YncB( thermonuclease family)
VILKKQDEMKIWNRFVLGGVLDRGSRLQAMPALSTRWWHLQMPFVLLFVLLLSACELPAQSDLPNFPMGQKGDARKVPPPKGRVSKKNTGKENADNGDASDKGTSNGSVLRLKKGTTLEGVAVHIADGDTFDLLTDEKDKIRIRMYGIDAPEKAQDFGQVSKEGIGKLMEGHRLKMVVANTDRYGRAVCNVYTVDKPEVWINKEMIQQGWAWHYVDYSKDAPLAQAEVEARKAKRGLWKQAGATPPWEFRADKRDQSKKKREAKARVSS